jgi:flagellin
LAKDFAQEKRSVVLSISTAGTSAFSGVEKAQAKQKDAIRELVSGLKINKAADDSAGLSISTALQAQLRSLNSASMNGQNAASLLQTADGGLDLTSQQLQRVRELTVQAAGTSDTGALDAIGKEVTQSLAEMDRISNTTVFGQQNLLNGSMAGGTRFQIGTSNTSAAEFNVAIPGAAPDSLGLSGLAAAIQGGNASSALSTIDDAITTVSDTRTNIGAATNALGNAVSAIGTEMLNTAGANSRIMDTDYAESIINASLANIQGEVGMRQLAASSESSRSLLSLMR